MTYPDLPQVFNDGAGHRILAIFAQGFQPQDDGFIQAGISDEAAYTRVKKEFVSIFDAEIKAQPANDWVLSSEHLHSRLTTQTQVNTLARFLKPYFEAITVYIHVRPQVDMARSLASTVVRGGGKTGLGFFDAIDETAPYYNFHSLVSRWVAGFGAENITVVPYKRQPDFQGYLLGRLGLDAAGFSPVLRANESLDWRVMALLSAIHPYRQNLFADRGLPAALEEFPCVEPLHIGLKVAQGIEQRMQKSNAALIAVRPELQAGDLTPDWADYNQPENLSMINQPVGFAEPLAVVLSQMQIRIKQERCMTRLAECERAMARGNYQRARSKLSKARDIMQEIACEESVEKALGIMLARAGNLHKKLEKQR